MSAGMGMCMRMVTDVARDIGMGMQARHGECAKCSWSMEAELWRHVRHVNKMYYQAYAPAEHRRSHVVVLVATRMNHVIVCATMPIFTPTLQVWGPQDFAQRKPGRDASVRVDPNRLGDLIEAALHEMEP